EICRNRERYWLLTSLATHRRASGRRDTFQRADVSSVKRLSGNTRRLGRQVRRPHCPGSPAKWCDCPSWEYSSPPGLAAKRPPRGAVCRVDHHPVLQPGTLPESRHRKCPESDVREGRDRGD